MIDAMIAYHSEEKFKEFHAGMVDDHEKWFEGVKEQYLKKKKQLRHLTHKRYQETCDMAMALGGIAPGQIPAPIPVPVSPPAEPVAHG